MFDVEANMQCPEVNGAFAAAEERIDEGEDFEAVEREVQEWIRQHAESGCAMCAKEGA